MSIKKTCGFCNSEYSVRPSQAASKFCSRRCSHESQKTTMLGSNNPNYRAAREKDCVVCGKHFKGVANHSKYCSHECFCRDATKLEGRRKHAIKYLAYNPNKGPKPRPRVPNANCAHCGVEFYSTKGHKYCGIACSNAGKVTRQLKACVVCQGMFRGAHQTCGAACRAAFRSIRQAGPRSHRWLGGKTSEAIRIRSSKEYDAWRRSVFARDNFTCQGCGSRGGVLHADHIKPFALHPELRFEISNGRTLCKPCHIKTDTWGYKTRILAATVGADIGRQA